MSRSCGGLVARRRVVPVLAVGLLVAAPVAVLAQGQCQPGADTSAAALAARYAPVLRFAPGEQYFPTIPFFTAFDGRDNNGNHLVDFEDPEEIAPLVRGDTLHPSWDVLDSIYEADQQETVPALPGGPPMAPVAPVPAVFYSIVGLSTDQQDAMRSYLKKDILAWDRAEKAGLGVQNLLLRPFRVIEYYFYYVRDKGLIGHPQDIEYAYVFVPADPALACDFRIVVGNGHTKWVPNNTLVLTNEFVLDRRNLARTDTLTSLIPELGGHSIAPDVPPFGQFRLGIDVNWQTTRAWGVRDVQSLAQMGYGGVYRPDMTLPRDTADHPVYLWPRGATFDYGQSYALLPADLFAQLSAELDLASGPHAPVQWPGTIADIRQSLDSIAELMGRPRFAGVDALDSTAVRRMALWNRPMIAPETTGRAELAPERGQVWEHWSYSAPPQVVFKSYLYPPSLKSIEAPRDILRLVSWGLTEWPGNSRQFQVGLVLPWFYLPFEPRGFLDLEVGLIAAEDFTDREFALDLSYYSSYFQHVSWYTSVAWIPDGSITGSHFTASVGPSFLVWMRMDKSLLGPLNVLRFSTGPRFRLSGPSSTAGVDWEFRFSFRQ